MSREREIEKRLRLRQKLRQRQRQIERQREKMPSTTLNHCRRPNSLKATHGAFIGTTTQDES